MEIIIMNFVFLKHILEYEEDYLRLYTFSQYGHYDPAFRS